MSNQNILSQNISSNLLVELSLEEQQLLSGGNRGFGGFRPRRRPWVGGWRPRRRW
jgi:hypothetical protein